MTRKFIGYIALAILLPLWGYVAFWPGKPGPAQQQLLSGNGTQNSLKALEDVDAPKNKTRNVPVKKSLWYSAKRDIYWNFLVRHKYDLVVMPVTPQAKPVDQIARSLITRELASHFREEIGLRVPDPELFELALGENQRAYSYGEAVKFAQATGAQSILQVSVGYVVPGTLRVFAELNKAPNSGYLKSPKRGTWEVEFSHRRLPYEAFKELIPEITKWLGLGRHKEVHTKGYEKHSHLDLPERSEKLFEDELDPLRAAYYLQLLGALYPDSAERERERLFERSLIALNLISPDSPDYRLLKARALFHLHRRPAALAILKKPESNAEAAFYSLLQGNLPTLKRQVKLIEGEVDRLLAFFETRDLEYAYGDKDHLTAKELALDFPVWKEFIDQRLPDESDWSLSSTENVKRKLDEMFPYEHLETDALLQGKRLSISDLRLPEEFEVEFVEWTLEHARALLTTRSELWCCRNPQWRPSRLDWLKWFETRAVSNMFKRVEHEVFMQGRDRRALKLLSRVSGLFDGHPRFAALRAWASSDLIETASNFDKKRLYRDSFEMASDAKIWSGGQGEADFWASEVLRWLRQVDLERYLPNLVEDYYKRVIYLRSLYEQDFPQRFLYSKQRSLIPRPDRIDLRAWEYTHNSPKYIYQKAISLAVNNGKEAAEEFLTQNSGRFEGYPALIKHIAKYKKAIRDEEGLQRIYEEAVSSESDEWEPYWEVGKKQASEGEYPKALETFMRYPYFSDSSRENRVTLSNRAYDAGLELYRRGATTQARPLLELSMGYRTGSSAGMSSNILIAILDKDFRTAAEIASARAARYPKNWTYAEYISLLHVVGFSEPASVAFDQLIPKMSDAMLWDAPFIGHRIQGESNQEIATWLKERIDLAMKNPWIDLPGRYAVMQYLIDRKIDASLPEFLEEAGDAYRARISPDGHVYIHNGRERVHAGPAHFIPEDERRRDIDFEPKLPLTYFARGYGALVSGDYHSAHAIFMEYAQYYGVGLRYAGAFVLPYLVRASIMSGRAPESSKYIEPYLKFEHLKFDVEIARAFAAAASRDHGKAISHLETAFKNLPTSSTLQIRPVFPWYQLVEAAEWLYEDSGNDKYRMLALDWSIKHQQIRPMFAWAYAVEAKLTDDLARRKLAIGTTEHLDRRSRRLQSFSAAERHAAQLHFQEINPFRIQETTTPSGGA